MQPKNLADPGIPLEALKVSAGHWSHSMRVSELITAKSWGIVPSEFDQLNISDQAEMIGLEESLAKVEQFEREQSERKTKSNKPSFVIE